MARPRKPWFRKSRESWFVEIDGKQHNLGPDKEEAHRKFHELMAERPAASASGSVAELLDAFILYSEETKAPSTVGWYTDYFQDFLDFLPHPGRSLPTEIKPKTVRDWVDSRGTAKRARITAIKAAFRWAHSKGWMEHNPLASMRRPEVGKREQVIDMHEFVNILRLSQDKCFRDLLTFSWDTGSRPQESKGLQADQVEFEKHRCVLHYLDSKGKRFSRVIYMTPRAERIVRRNLSVDNQFVFLNTRGEPWTANAVRTRFRRLEDKLGKRYTQYAFRHTFATRKLKAGVSPIDVAELLGHSDVSTLAKIYQHVAQDPSHLLKALNSETS